MQNLKNFHINVEDNIAMIEFNVSDKSENLISAVIFDELRQIVKELKTNEQLLGGVIFSNKRNFCLGADVGGLSGGGGASKADATNANDKNNPAAPLYQSILSMHKVLRDLETCGKPMVAALNGSALGGGLELALACHYRVSSDNPKTRIGLPEARLGLLPGAGGTQRLPRMISAANALPLILQGTALKADKAQAFGIINTIVPPSELLSHAKAWVKDNPTATQPWDKKGFRIPGGAPHDKGAQGIFVGGNAQLRKNTYGNYPAQQYIMQAVYEGLLVPIDTALRIEARYFTKILMDPRAQAMMRSLFLSLQELKKGARRPQDVPSREVKKLGILGAGLMGSGIAFAAAAKGIEVVLLDRAAEDANKGKARVAKIMEKRRLDPQRANKVTATDNYEMLAGSDLIIEAVFENRELKAEVTKKAEAQLAPDGIMSSNTSTLPITGLAKASKDASKFIGLHFFSPVERMELVEIISGKETSKATLAAAMDFVAQIGKTPIVVNDSRGFYTSRCFGTYVGEGIAMLSEGVPPAMIENAGKSTGMPMPPLALADAVGLDLSYAVRQQTKKDLGDSYEASPSDSVIEKLVGELGRTGKKSGKGFYDYSDDGKSKKLWSGLSELAGKQQDVSAVDMEALKNRLLYIQSLEALRCLEEQVITDIRDGDIGAILGWGFAPWSGGPLSLVDVVGAKLFKERCEAFAAQCGKRFNPPKILEELARSGEKLYTRYAPNKKAG